MFSKLLTFAAAYFLMSLIVFATMFFLWPGFPFFPKHVLTKEADNVNDVRLGTGYYEVLYFIKGGEKLAVARGEAGHLSITARTPDGTEQPVPVVPLNYYF